MLLTDSGFGADQTEKLYIIGGIFIIASVLWWTLFRTLVPRWVMSLPFAFYGSAFLLVGLAPFIPSGGGRDWARNVATGLYATASASGSLFFALNFGDEGKLKNPNLPPRTTCARSISAHQLRWDQSWDCNHFLIPSLY